MNPLLTALNGNGGRRGGAGPLSAPRPGLALKPPKREAPAQGGEGVERRTGEENANLRLSPRSSLSSPSCPWQTASAPPVPWPWRRQLAPGPDHCAFIRQPHSLSGEAEWQGPGSRAESEEQRSLSLETGGGEGKELAKNRAVRAPRWCPRGTGGRDGGSARGTVESRGEVAFNALPTSEGPTSQDRPEAKHWSTEVCHPGCLSPGSSRLPGAVWVQEPGSLCLSQGFPRVEIIPPDFSLSRLKSRSWAYANLLDLYSNPE